MLLMPFTAMALTMDHLVRDPMLWSVGHRSAVRLPQMAVPFSGSLLLGFVFGLIANTILGAFLRIARHNNPRSLLFSVANLSSRRPRMVRGFMGVLSALTVMMLWWYFFRGISPYFFLMGVFSVPFSKAVE